MGTIWRRDNSSPSERIYAVSMLVRFTGDGRSSCCRQVQRSCNVGGMSRQCSRRDVVQLSLGRCRRGGQSSRLVCVATGFYSAPCDRGVFTLRIPSIPGFPWLVPEFPPLSTCWGSILVLYLRCSNILCSVAGYFSSAHLSFFSLMVSFRLVVLPIYYLLYRFCSCCCCSSPPPSISSGFSFLSLSVLNALLHRSVHITFARFPHHISAPSCQRTQQNDAAGEDITRPSQGADGRCSTQGAAEY